MADSNGVASRSELLNVLSDVKTKVQDKLGIVDFPIPQFVIIGKQSVGKSRLIEALAGEQFNFVSGTLGSRRPTILEFRNVTSRASKWQVLNRKSNKWEEYPVARVMDLMAEAHESLGATVSAEPMCVRIESPHCVDMQIVDLPGFREFCMDKNKEDLAKQIEQLDMSFMLDERNVMICVEEAGDAATMATLARCKQIDPRFQRTILVRNKLDKYYHDLTYENINNWLEGFGDLPPELTKFCLTLPHWMDKDKAGNPLPPPVPFAGLRQKMSEQDVFELKGKGASEKFLPTIGFNNFAKYMETRIEKLFVAAIGPILKKLRELKLKQEEEIRLRRDEMRDTNPELLATTIRDCGMSFSHALSHIMEGYVSSAVGRMTLEQELRDFHNHFSMNEHDFSLLPSEDFSSLDDYIDYLKSDVKVSAFDIEINGGAQFRRVMYECEVFLRFAELGVEACRRDVVQARGVSTSQLTWRDVIVKVLANQGHMPMKKRIWYVANRIGFFFQNQKVAILDFMYRLKGSADEHLFSALYPRHARLMMSNELIKQLVYTAFDKVCERQMQQFSELFSSTMSSTFSNPWTFLKKNSVALEDASTSGSMELPSFEDTKQRIPMEIESRGSIEAVLTRWIGDIPVESHMLDESVERVQTLVNKTFAFIRSQVADQMELFAESFFKLPLMRKMEEDMSKIELNEMDLQTYRVRRDHLEGQVKTLEDGLGGVNECLDKLQAFALKSKAIRTN